MSINYNKLAESKSLVTLSGNAWTVFLVDGLNPGDYYAVSFKMWAATQRPVRVEIYKGDGKLTSSKPEFSNTFTIGPTGNEYDRETWQEKRYKLDKERHDGAATIKVGWPTTSNLISTGIDLLLAVAPLTSKKIKIANRRSEGLCPTCGLPGYWRAMAMVCLEHGVFIG